MSNLISMTGERAAINTINKNIAIFLITSAMILFLYGCSSLENEYTTAVKDEFKKQPLQKEEILTEADIAHLPAPVKKYLIYTGSVGKSKIQNVRFEFSADMYKKPGASPMNALSEQYNFFGSYTRLFFMKSSMMFIPLRIYHAYAKQQASFVVRAASLFNPVNFSGKDLTTGETVTLLNDICLFAPGSLIDRRLTWKAISGSSAMVTLANGEYKVSAVLYFNDKGGLVNFVSDDRFAAQDNGTLRKARWSTPVKDYKSFDGRNVPTYGEAIWNYPEGDFVYGKFRLKKIEYNVNSFSR